MMKPTSNAVLINGKQGAADRRGGGGGRRRRVRPLLIVLPVFKLWGGWRRGRGEEMREAWPRMKNEERGSPGGQQSNPSHARKNTRDSIHRALWSRPIFDWQSQPVAATSTPFPDSSSPNNNTTMQVRLIEIQKPVLTPQASTETSRRGRVAVVAHWGPIKDRC